MSTIKLKYEVLVSGIYPFDAPFEKCGFKLVKNEIDEKKYNDACKESVFYLSPFMGMCCYPDSRGTPVYLTFQKDEDIEIDYGDIKEYDVAFTNQYLESLHLFESIEAFEKTMVLEVNNDIKFPVKMIRVYDPNGNFVTFRGDFIKLNIPCLISNDHAEILETINRQNNRLGSGISYEKVQELADNNSYFCNALAMYHSAFSVSDYKVGFILLITALEALVSLSTYAVAERCDGCGQPKYKIRASVSENVGLLLMDQDGVIGRRMKALYDKRSGFLHSGNQDVSKQDEQDVREYVRKVLLMYWFVSMNKSVCDHKTIMAEIRSGEYKENLMYKHFLTALDNMTFEEKRRKIFNDTLRKES